MINENRIWPEGATFIKTVSLPTIDEPIDVAVTYTVPPFEKVVEAFENRDPNKAYPQFRQFIIDWDLEDKLTDTVLMSLLMMNIEVSRVIYAGWCDHMKEHIAARQLNLMQAPATIN